MASKCANTVVVVHAGGTRLVDQWIEHPNVTAAVVAFLPGQDSGEALVRLLHGDDGTNFSGRMPYTVARNESDYGAVLHPCGRADDQDIDPQCDFAEGSHLDYRSFDARNVTPRFEFGFGLSYTTFGYASLGIHLAGEALTPSTPCNGEDQWEVAFTATAEVTNTGDVFGQEVAQLYIGIPGAAPKQLRGFEKVGLAPGESATVTFEVQRRDLAVWDVVRQAWVIEGGEYHVYVGASSRDIKLKDTVTI